MNFKQRIEEILNLAICTGNVDFCDFQCNAAFQLAKEQKKPPMDIANDLAEGFISRATTQKFDTMVTVSVAAPGFINFTLTPHALEVAMGEILKTRKLPLPAQEARTIFFDYGGANIAKELHIGHLRSPIIGESLKRCFKKLGHRTISDTYFGDWGLQMGLVLAQLIDENYVEGTKLVKDVTLDTFNVLYPRAAGRAKSDPVFRARAEQITVDLQNQTQPYFDIWKQIRKISVDKICENYAALNCTFDIFGGESDAAGKIDTVIEYLKKHGARTSDGCLVFDVKTETDTAPMPPVILQKGNGGDLYATTDITTIFTRYEKFKPDEFVYCADFRQELHFKQIFRTVKMSRLVPDDVKFTHVSYGTMNGADGKPFKTRSGETIKLQEILTLVTEAAKRRMTRKNPLDAQKVGIAALKFADLANNVRKDYVFDPEKFTSFEGKTGPYLLYTVARINSILKKAKIAPSAYKFSDSNRQIARCIIKLADSFAHAAQNFSLNGLVDAAFELASAFNLFYTAEKIATSSENLAICDLVKFALLEALDTLAINPVEEM